MGRTLPVVSWPLPMSKLLFEWDSGVEGGHDYVGN